MQVQKALNRMEILEKEMQRVRRSLISQVEISLTRQKKTMHKAALDFLNLKNIPDRIELGSVELIRKERKHARGY